MKKLFLAASALALSGCALLDPYRPGINADIYDAEAFDCPDNATKSDKIVGYNALHCSMRSASKLQVKYLHAAGQHEMARTISGAAIIGGASYALLLGVADGIAAANSTEQIAAIGAGSAALFGVTSLFTSPRRQDVYIAGAHAAACAQLASSPFLISPDDYAMLQGAVGSAGGESLGGVYANVTALREIASRHVTTQNPITNAEQAILTAANAAIEAAPEALAKGRTIKSEIDSSAPAKLRAGLQRIDTAVAAQLRQAQPNLNAILTTQGNLAGVAGRISPSFRQEPQAAPGAQEESQTESHTLNPFAQAEQDRDEAFRVLRREATKLRAHILYLNGLAENIENRIESAGEIDQCNLGEINLAVRVTPTTLTFKEGTAGRGAFIVQKGQPPFVVEIPGDISGLDVNFSTPLGTDGSVSMGRTGVVTYTNAGDGDYDLFIHDVTGTATQMRIKVEKTDGGSRGDGNNQQTQLPTGIREAEKTLVPNEAAAKQIQTNLCVETVDAKFGPKTRAAIKQYHRDMDGDAANDDSDGLTSGDATKLKADDAKNCESTILKSAYEAAIERPVVEEVLEAIQSGASMDSGGRNFIEGARASRNDIDENADENGRTAVTRKLCKAVLKDADKCKPPS